MYSVQAAGEQLNKRDFCPDIGTKYPITGLLLQIYPLLTGEISGNRRYRVEKNDITDDVGEQYQDIRISCLEYTDIIPDVLKHQDTDIVFWQILGPIFHLLRRRPSPAALVTALALQLVQPIGPRPAWTLCTPRGDY
jgi:hypothetical protein